MALELGLSVNAVFQRWKQRDESQGVFSGCICALVKGVWWWWGGARPNFCVNGAEISHWCFLYIDAKMQAFSRGWNVVERTEFNLERSCTANRDVVLWRTDEKSVLKLQPNGAKHVLTDLGLLKYKGKTFVREGKRLNRKLWPSHQCQYLLLLSGKEMVLQCSLKTEFGGSS